MITLPIPVEQEAWHRAEPIRRKRVEPTTPAEAPGARSAPIARGAISLSIPAATGSGFNAPQPA